MNYVGDFSIFVLLVVVIYAVLPETVESRALEARNYIAEDDGETNGDDVAIRRLENEISAFVNAYLAYRNLQNGSKRSQLDPDPYALAASKRNWEDKVRRSNYRYPIDTHGGYLSSGVTSGIGR